MEEKISIKRENVLTAYKQSTKEQKALLENMFGKDVFKPKNIMERVKTFEDAVAILGENHTLVKEYFGVVYNNIVITKNLIAYLKLRIICEALNEGWKPKFDGEEYRYFPWFFIYTKEEYEKLNEDDKKKYHVVGRSSCDSYTFCGVVFSVAYYTSSHSYANFGYRLAFKTGELAEYCGKQFIDIWADYLFA